MRILVATAGALSPTRVAELLDRWLDSAPQVTVLAVIEVPHPFVDTLETPIWRPLLGDGEAEPPPDVTANYVEERGRKRTEPLASVLEGRGIPNEVMHVEGADPAQVIQDVAARIDADLIVLGATRPLFPEWDSVSVRLMQESSRPLLVIPAGTPSSGSEDEAGFVDELAR